MDEFRFSFFCFLALVIVLPWALGIVVCRRIARREKSAQLTIASMAALAFLIGVVWWTVIHPAICSSLPAGADPNAPPRWGLAILAGVTGVVCLTIGTVVLIVVAGIWDHAVPGTLAHLSARLKPEEKYPPETDS
jgi:drug/metabolite transporter (DMT)-like permease